MRSTEGLVLLVALAAFACGASEEAPGDGKLIENYSPPGGGLIWTCSDGTQLVLDSETSKRSTLCLGIDGSECPDESTPGPGTAECEDPSYNAFKNTCVEEYFSCFQPTGLCELGENGQDWSEGARQVRDYMGYLAAYIPANGTEPCIVASASNGVVNYQQR